MIIKSSGKIVTHVGGFTYTWGNIVKILGTKAFTVFPFKLLDDRVLVLVNDERLDLNPVASKLIGTDVVGDVLLVISTGGEFVSPDLKTREKIHTLYLNKCQNH